MSPGRTLEAHAAFHQQAAPPLPAGRNMEASKCPAPRGRQGHGISGVAMVALLRWNTRHRFTRASLHVLPFFFGEQAFREFIVSHAAQAVERII